MRDDIENWDALLMRLKHSLRALAMPADTQLELFPDFVCKVEELALGFDHCESGPLVRSSYHAHEHV